jgi:hypothetical protein
MGLAKVLGFEGENRLAADLEGENAGKQICHYPTHATYLITMKMPTAITAVSANDIPMRPAISMKRRFGFMPAA